MYSLLLIKNLSVDFQSDGEITHAVNQITFEINRGETVALVGESGSGKSVTALSILQLLPTPPALYNSGEILFSEDRKTKTDLLHIDKRSLQKIRGNKIAMIFQEPMTSLNPVMTCGSQVMETIRRHKKLSGKESKNEVINWFRKVKLPKPENIFHRYPHQLSGGQKQRVMIAIAMCCQPSLLICDEPTTALDVTVQKNILQLLKDLQQQENIGIIFITHDLGVVAEMADRAIVMHKGEIVEQNTIKEIFKNPQHPYTKALLACRPSSQKKGTRLPVVSDFLTEMKQDKSNKNSESSLQPSDRQFSYSALIEVKNLSVWFPSKKTFLGKTTEHTKAVDEISFEIFEGETLGLVGESGCGKTTLGRALLRLVEPTSGHIIYKKTDLVNKKRNELRPLRKELQIVFQDPYSSLNPRLTIGSAITEVLKVHSPFQNYRQRKEKVIELLEKVNLEARHFNRYPHEFSGGQRQRIVIARALSVIPSFIVCDESVSALDVSIQAQVLNLLNDLKKEFGFTIVFISHDLSVVHYISDRIMVMNNGKIVESGPSDDIYNNPQTEYTRQLISSIPKGIAAGI